MINTQEFETDRLKIVPLSVEYVEDIFNMLNPEITRYMSIPVTGDIKDTRSWAYEKIPLIKEGRDFTIVILDKTTGEFLGGGGIHHIDTKTPEFGIWIKKDAHGHKYGREAITGLKVWADKNLVYDYLKYPVSVKNISSRKIPESLDGKVFRKYFDKNGAGQKMLLAEYRIYPRS